jgi:hypothetical protein
MKIIALILSLLLLTSCSNPDTSGGVTLSRGGGDDANEFPNGSCEGQHENTPDLNTGCGWIHVNEESYYIMPGAILSYADLRYADLREANLGGANLRDATLWNADLRGLDLSEVKLHHVSKTPQTICPNGIHWTFQGHNCPF